MKKYFGAFILLTLAVSCKKDKDKDCSFSEANFVGSYKITALKYKASASATEVDEFALFSACEKDDIITFNSNHTITYTDAGTVCTPAGNDTGAWTYINSSSVNIDGDVANVASFDCTGIIFTISGTTAGELTTVTLARQ
ncbi:MAG: lipocalin family protein [Bacteroidetes bacterium]|nr:lipocalin family protein [Bacteroidota bacterium]